MYIYRSSPRAHCSGDEPRYEQLYTEASTAVFSNGMARMSRTAGSSARGEAVTRTSLSMACSGLECEVWGFGFGVWGLGVEFWGLGCGVWGLRFGVWGLGFGVWGLEIGVSGFGFRVCGLWFGVWG